LLECAMKKRNRSIPRRGGEEWRHPSARPASQTV